MLAKTSVAPGGLQGQVGAFLDTGVHTARCTGMIDPCPSPAATRTEALNRLHRFAPAAGREYASRRNYDLPDRGHPHVSQLSPYLRHRLITEPEVIQAVLGRHSATAAEKFIQEVVWRTYWKGWLEMRPGVWGAYRQGLDRVLARAEKDADLGAALARAEAGQTDIDAFNAWVRELVSTGYLHNHARMWVASIWIFTLRLPWEAGADFFMRHLLDGDPASNTLSWRWVAGLQTRGKHYIARSSNISKYTEGRHNPEWRLETGAAALEGPDHSVARPAPLGELPQPGLRTGVLLTEEDLSPGFILDALQDQPVAHAGLISVDSRSPRPMSPLVATFTRAAMEDALARWASKLGRPAPLTPHVADIVDWARAGGVEQIVAPFAPVGPAASALAALQRALNDDGIVLVQVMRDWDRAAWPHATAGFFKFKAQIPNLIRGL